ncbi:MAG: hypothetical protein QXP58_07745 [Thermoprotei archaeon]
MPIPENIKDATPAERQQVYLAAIRILYQNRPIPKNDAGDADPEVLEKFQYQFELFIDALKSEMELGNRTFVITVLNEVWRIEPWEILYATPESFQKHADLLVTFAQIQPNPIPEMTVALREYFVDNDCELYYEDAVLVNKLIDAGYDDNDKLEKVFSGRVNPQELVNKGIDPSTIHLHMLEILGPFVKYTQ